MWWLVGGNGKAQNITKTLVRHFSQKRAPNLRKINPKVAPQEAASIAEALYNLIKQHGPLTVSSSWNHAKEAGIEGLNSKTHLKLMLKWMRGRNMLRQFCNQVGSSKKFLLSTLPGESQIKQPNDPLEVSLKPGKPNVRKVQRA